jgi:hypothetical protein
MKDYIPWSAVHDQGIRAMTNHFSLPVFHLYFCSLLYIHGSLPASKFRRCFLVLAFLIPVPLSLEFSLHPDPKHIVLQIIRHGCVLFIPGFLIIQGDANIIIQVILPRQGECFIV